MGYRWECNNCEFITWDENNRKTHEKETEHILYGGSKAWSHPDGDYFKWLKRLEPTMILMQDLGLDYISEGYMYDQNR